MNRCAEFIERAAARSREARDRAIRQQVANLLSGGEQLDMREIEAITRSKELEPYVCDQLPFEPEPVPHNVPTLKAQRHKIHWETALVFVAAGTFTVACFIQLYDWLAWAARAGYSTFVQ